MAPEALSLDHTASMCCPHGVSWTAHSWWKNRGGLADGLLSIPRSYLTPVTSKVLSGRLILAHLLLWRTLIIDFYTGRTRAERLPHPGGTPLPPTLALILVEINVIWQTFVESPLLYDQDTSLLINPTDGLDEGVNPSRLNNGKSGKNNSVPQYSIRLCRSY